VAGPFTLRIHFAAIFLNGLARDVDLTDVE
jgi:hypothetical protein